MIECQPDQSTGCHARRSEKDQKSVTVAVDDTNEGHGCELSAAILDNCVIAEHTSEDNTGSYQHNAKGGTSQ